MSWSCLDIQNGLESKERYQNFQGFIGGICAASPVKYSDGLMGYIDRSFQFIVDPTYESCHDLSCGRLVAYDKKTECWHVLSSAGNKLFELQHKVVEHYCEGLAAVSNEFTSYGFVDFSGKLVIEYKYEYVSSFSEGLCFCCEKGKVGYIDSRGEYVIPPQYCGGSRFSGGRAVVSKDQDTDIVVDNAGNELFEMKSGGMRQVSLGVIMTRNSGLNTYYNQNFECIWFDR